ncbi:MAG: hypothetical protein QNI84_14115 [Henriciella sp.]|nr:hypothetical protein [Henriciella sp.]
MRIFKILAVVCEVVMILLLLAICSKVISVYDNIPLPILSYIFPDLHVNDVFALMQAMLIALLPVFVFKTAFASDLFSNSATFFATKMNRVWFCLGLLALIFVFSLELYNLTTEAKVGLEELIDCDGNNPFCNQLAVDAEREKLMWQAERAFPLALLFSSINLVFAAVTARLFHSPKI